MNAGKPTQEIQCKKFNAKNSMQKIQRRKFNAKNSMQKIQCKKFNAKNSMQKIQRRKFNAKKSNAKNSNERREPRNIVPGFFSFNPVYVSKSSIHLLIQYMIPVIYIHSIYILNILFILFHTIQYYFSSMSYIRSITLSPKSADIFCASSYEAPLTPK